MEGTQKQLSEFSRSNGLLTPESRYLAIGYDDFRDSDFTLLSP